MNVPSDQIQYKKKVGMLGPDPVIELGLIGGLAMIVCARNGRVETLGTGPHRAVAQHIAKKRNPDLEWTDLSKADHVQVEHFQFLLPYFENMTDRFNSLNG